MNKDHSVNIDILPASVAEKSVIKQMMQLYLYDFSEFSNTDLNEHGYFDYSYLDHYWVEEVRHPYLVKVDRKLGGFALINQSTNLPSNQYCLAEFFILRNYRNQGIGRQVAIDILDLFPGRWEIYQANSNLIAKKFWQNVLETYTHGNYIETVMENNGWNCIMRSFYNTDNPKS